VIYDDSLKEHDNDEGEKKINSSEDRTPEQNGKSLYDRN
jgi:hypothetical protein